jgi:hypothetical protein
LISAKQYLFKRLNQQSNHHEECELNVVCYNLVDITIDLMTGTLCGHLECFYLNKRNFLSKSSPYLASNCANQFHTETVNRYFANNENSFAIRDLIKLNKELKRGSVNNEIIINIGN